jgi:hypothetical protein
MPKYVRVVDESSIDEIAARGQVGLRAGVRGGVIGIRDPFSALRHCAGPERPTGRIQGQTELSGIGSGPPLLRPHPSAAGAAAAGHGPLPPAGWRKALVACVARLGPGGPGRPFAIRVSVIEAPLRRLQLLQGPLIMGGRRQPQPQCHPGCTDEPRSTASRDTTRRPMETDAARAGLERRTRRPAGACGLQLTRTRAKSA